MELDLQLVDDSLLTCQMIVDEPQSIFIINVDNDDYNNYDFEQQASNFANPVNNRTTFYSFRYTGPLRDLFRGPNNRCVCFNDFNEIIDIRKVTKMTRNTVTGWGYKYGKPYIDWLQKHKPTAHSYKFEPDTQHVHLYNEAQEQERVSNILEF